jgi:hypothetical protein
MIRRMLILGMIVGVLSFSAALAANEPYVISFQGRLEGVQLPVNIIFTLYDAETAGSSVWTETHTNVDVDIDTGIFNELLGNQQDLSGELFSATGALWLQVNVNGNDLTPRQPLTAAPYAFVAHDLKGGVAHATSSSSINAIEGVNTSNGYGVFGKSQQRVSIYGLRESGAQFAWAAVQGQNDQTATGLNPGVYGLSNMGVAVYGVKDNTNSVNARPAIFGDHRETTAGNNPGVKGRSKAGYGVYGVKEDGGSSDKAAIYGYHAEATSGDNPGVYGFSRSGYGVRGHAQTVSKAGVYGTGGIGVWGHSSTSDGVYGDTVGNDKAGVYGKSDRGAGVYGYKPETTFNDRDAAVYGKNEEASAGENPGVKGESIKGYGVYGKSTDSYGVYGVNATWSKGAVYGENTDTGTGYGIGGQFIANANNGKGVYAQVKGTSGATRYGVFGKAEGSRGVGVYGEASDTGANSINVGGRFIASGGQGIGVFGQGNTALKLAAGKIEIAAGSYTVSQSPFSTTINKAAGTIHIPSNHSYVTVNNNKVGVNSIILLTPEYKSTSYPASDKRRFPMVYAKTTGSFRIAIPVSTAATNYDVHFLVIN